MALTAAGACAVLLVTAALLLYGAVKDLMHYSISNVFVLVLGLVCTLFGGYALEVERLQERIRRLEDEVRGRGR